MSQPSDIQSSLSSRLIEYGYAAEETDDDESTQHAFTTTMNRVFERLVAQARGPLWLGIVETLEPGSSAWMDAFGDPVVSLAEGASFWPGTERLSLGDTRVRAVPVEAFGRDWKNVEALTGEGFYPAFDPFLFCRRPEGDLCLLQTVGHEGMASCLVSEDDLPTGQWLESLGFSRADGPWEAPSGPGDPPLCGVSSRAKLVEIFGEESVASIERRAGK